MHSRSVPSVPAAGIREVTGSVLPTAVSNDAVLYPVLTAIAEVLHGISPLGWFNPALPPVPCTGQGGLSSPVPSPECAATAAPAPHHPASVAEPVSAGNHLVAVVIVGCLPASDVRGLSGAGASASAADVPCPVPQAPSAAAGEVAHTEAIAFPAPRRDREPLTTYLCGLQQQQRDLVLRPDTWAKLIGRSERELRRAMGSGAMTWRKKARGRDHASYVISIDALVTYATTIAAVWSGDIDKPEWWTSVKPRVAA